MFNYFIRKFHNLCHDHKFSEILTGAVWAVSARVIGTGLGLICSIIVARIYGAKAVGIVALLNSFMTITTTFTVLGTNTSILRLIPEHITKYSTTSAFKVYHKTQYLVIAVSLAFGAICFWGADFISSKVFSKPSLTFYFSLASIFIVFKSLIILNQQAVRGLRIIKGFAIMQALPQVMNLIFLIPGSLLWSCKEIPVYSLLVGLAITGIIGWIMMVYTFKKNMQPQDSVHPIPIRDIFSISLPMLMTATMTFVIGETGLIMVSMFRPEAEVGYYSIAVKLATITTFILTAVNSMVGPKFSDLYHSGKVDELFYIAQKSAKLIFWISTPILMSFVILGKQIIYIFYGHEFIVAYPALIILVIGQFVQSISGATNLFMNMTGSQNVFRNIVFIAAIINILLNYLFIPKYGILGASIAAMVSIAGWNIATIRYIKKKFGNTTGYFPKIVQQL